MRKLPPVPLAFPGFRGVTRVLILLNLISYAMLLVVRTVYGEAGWQLAKKLALQPTALASGYLWQPFTYSLVHLSLSTTLFELLSLWFLLGFLENLHPSGWVFGLYGASVLGAAATAIGIFGLTHLAGGGDAALLSGCFGGIFGLLAIIGTLHGETEFLLFFTIAIKARYLAAIYALVALAMLFSQEQVYALAQLGGAVAGLLYVWMAPQRGFTFWASESWFSLVNGFYRWKRRRAGRKFEVYMRSQGKTVHVDGYGRPIKDDNPTDKSRWN
jgi:membrane associated rhomboid family serine protease